MGSDKPKALFTSALLSQKPLIQLHAERIVTLKRLAAEKGRREEAEWNGGEHTEKGDVERANGCKEGEEEREMAGEGERERERARESERERVLAYSLHIWASGWWIGRI